MLRFCLISTFLLTLNASIFADDLDELACAEVDGGWIEASSQYYGFLGSPEADESILNPEGRFGSASGPESVVNVFGPLNRSINSGENGTYVSEDVLPKIIKAGQFVGYISNNGSYSPSISLTRLTTNCVFQSLSPRFLVEDNDGVYAAGSSRGPHPYSEPLAEFVFEPREQIQYRVDYSDPGQLKVELKINDGAIYRILDVHGRLLDTLKVSDLNEDGVWYGSAVMEYTATVATSGSIFILASDWTTNEGSGETVLHKGSLWVALEPIDPSLIDTDNDGIPDVNDAFPEDSSEVKDSDGDGIGDNKDTFPEDPDEYLDADLDGLGDSEDLDDDNDGIKDDADNCPFLPNQEQLDNDADALGDACDLDDDNDGYSDEVEQLVGTSLKSSGEYPTSGGFISLGGSVFYFDSKMKIARIPVDRNGTTEQAASVDYHSLEGVVGKDGLHFQGVAGTLEWAAGDSNTKFVEIELKPDPKESREYKDFFLMLSNPSPSARLDTYWSQVVISDFATIDGWGGEIQFAHGQTVREGVAAQMYASRLYSSLGRVVLRSEVELGGKVIPVGEDTIVWEDGDQSIRKIEFTVPYDPKQSRERSGRLILRNVDSDYPIGTRAGPYEISSFFSVRDDDTVLSSPVRCAQKWMRVGMGMDFPFLLNREDKGDSELKLSIYSSFYDELLEINWITGDLRPKILELGSIQGPLFDLFYESVLHWNCYVSQSNYSRARETALDADYDSDGVAYFYDFDADNDGTLDPLDFFPNDPSEIDDSDEDGIGNNADPDDDNDGFTDEEELADGTNPLSRFSCRSGCFSFDIDENKEAKALSDGLLVIRHLFGFSGESLTSGATTTEGARTSAEAISGYLSDADSELDIDGDGQSKALTDGLLLIRYLFGFSGDSLTAGAIGEGAERTTAEEIEAYIGDRVPQT